MSTSSPANAAARIPAHDEVSFDDLHGPDSSSTLCESSTSDTAIFPRPFTLKDLSFDFADGTLAVTCEACTAYAAEMSLLARLAHPFVESERGEPLPLISGLGLYPEMGSDVGPLLATRRNGTLVGMSLHEGELLGLMGLGQCYGITPHQLLGPPSALIHIHRDASLIMDGARDDRSEVSSRLKTGYSELLGLRDGPLARGVGSSDWRHHARILQWKDFAFVPSASGDTVAIDDTLRLYGKERFDVLWLKGSLGYRFKDDPDAAIAWCNVLNEKYLAPGAVVLVAASDRPLDHYFEREGFVGFRSGAKVAYSPGCSLTLSYEAMLPLSKSYGIVPPDGVHVRFHPIGDFHIWIKPLETPAGYRRLGGSNTTN